MKPTCGAYYTLLSFAAGRGTKDDSKTWHEYGSPAVNVSAALAQDADAGRIGAAFLFGDLAYATGHGLTSPYLALHRLTSPNLA